MPPAPVRDIVRLTSITAPRQPNSLAGLLLIGALAPAAAWVALHSLQLRPAASGAAMAVWLLLAAPCIEEFVLRSLLQRGLQERLGSATAAAIGATAAFVLLHLPAHGLQALWWALPGWALAHTWHRSRSLAACVMLHAWFNACLMMAA